ncbi:MAG: hypothetical protein J0L56_19385 [Chitinophagales bacterium]|nr:hypothetical protein [Chitinophagales bacterium]
MNEIVLAIMVIALLVFAQFALAGMSKKRQFLIRLVAASLLLILIWGFSSEGKIAFKVVMSAIVLSYSVTNYIQYRKL